MFLHAPCPLSDAAPWGVQTWQALAARRSCAQRNVSPKYSPVPDRWSMKPQVSNRSLMAGCFSKHTAAHILQSNPCGFCGVWLAIARFLKSKRIRPLGWPRPKEAVPGCCQLSSCSFQGMLMPNDAKRLVCRVFVCFLFSPGKRWFWVKPHQSHGFGSPKALEVPADNFKHLAFFCWHDAVLGKSAGVASRLGPFRCSIGPQFVFTLQTCPGNFQKSKI